MSYITERTLRNWRQDALRPFNYHDYDTTEAEHIAIVCDQQRTRILRLTMELMDIKLMEKIRGNKK